MQRGAALGVAAASVVGCCTGAARDLGDGRASGGSSVHAGDARGTRPDAHRSSESGAKGRDAARHSPGRIVAYASGYGPDLHVFSVGPTGALAATQTVPAFGASPSFLAASPTVTRLYAVDEETTGRVGAYAIDGAAGALRFLHSVSSGGAGPAFVTVDATGKWVLVANYGDGTVSVLPVDSDGSLGSPTMTLAVGMNAHMIALDPANRFAFVPCLGADYVAQLTFDETTGTLAPNATAPHVATATGAGPRHLAFHPNGRRAYVINETNSTVGIYAFDPTLGTLAAVTTVSTLPPGFSGTNTAAEVHVHPSGSWLLASNRGADDLVVFAIDPTTGALRDPHFIGSGGSSPRDFALSPEGSSVYVANQATGNVVSFDFDATRGTLSPSGAAAPVAAASFVGLFRLP